MTDDVVMRRLVVNVVRDGSEVTGEMRCELMRRMFVGGEVCSVGVSVGSLLSPRLLSPRLLSPGSRTSGSSRGSEGTSASGGS